MGARQGKYADVPNDGGAGINAKLLKIINEALDLVDETKRSEFIDYVFTSFDKVTGNARRYAKAHGEDYGTVLRKMIDEDKEFDEKLQYFRKSS